MKSTNKPEGNEGVEVGHEGPTSNVEVGRRLSLVIGLYDTKKSAANQAKTTPEMLNRYAQGVHRVPLEAAIRLTVPKGVSLDWLATGEGPMMQGGTTATSPPTNEPNTPEEALLGNLVEGLERYLAKESLALRPQPKARVVVLFHRILVRRRRNMQVGGIELPAELYVAGRPIDIATDPDLADIVSIAS